ncbi:MAG TPA: S-layer homology domain-containing protein [Syntrophomonas sp.]|nr:S-layer homology domain-containing protein [Syntrophomonas sp.]
MKKGIQIIFIGLIICLLIGLKLQTAGAADSPWIFIDGNSTTGLNKATTQGAHNPLLTICNNELYSVWEEGNTTETYRVHVKKRNSEGSWELIDPNSTHGLNRNGTATKKPAMAVYNNELYVAWPESRSDSGNYYALCVSQYTGSGTSWSAVDGANGRISASLYADCQEPVMIVYDNKLYAAWAEMNDTYNIQLKCYDGINWSVPTNASNNPVYDVTVGIDFTSGKTASNPTLAVYDGKLYIAWEEFNASNKKSIRLKCYDKATQTLSDAPDGGGHYYSASKTAEKPALAVYDDSLYLAWQEKDNDLELEQIRMKKYNGTWEWLDGHGTTGLNRKGDCIANDPAFCVYNNELYLSWVEEKGSEEINWGDYNVRVKRLKNNTWSFIDGDSFAGLNKQSDQYAHAPAFTADNEGIYLSWYESNSSGSDDVHQIRVAMLPFPKVTLAAPVALTEDTLDSSSISVTLAGTSIIDPLNQDNFSLLNLPLGLTIESVVAGADSSHCTVNLAFDGSDFDTDISNLGLTILSSQLTCGEDLSAETPLSITAVNDSESISITDDGNITEGNEDGEVITVTLNGGTFAPTLTQANWQVENLPDGIIWTISRESHTTAKITLSGNATTSYTADITDLTVTCNTNEYRDSTGGTALSASSGVTFKACPRVIAPVSIVHKAYIIGDQIIIDVQFNKTVRVSGVPYIPITIGTDNVQAQYISGDNTDTLRFSYSVAAGQQDTDGISLGTAIVLPSGASIKDGVGNDADLTLNIGSTADIYVDGILPTMTGAVRDNDTQITATLSENCTNLNHSNDGGFSVTEIGTTTSYSVSATAQGSDDRHIVLTVADMGKSGKEGVTVTYTAGGNGDIQDTAGNAMASDTTGLTIVAWDTTAPTISSVSDITADNTYIDIQFSEGIYGADDGTTPAAAGHFNLNFDQKTGNATGAVISSVKKNDGDIEGSAGDLSGGETEVRIFFTLTGTPNGAETIAIKPKNNASLYDKAGNTMADSQNTGEKYLHDMTVPPADTDPPTLVSAQMLDDTHITAALSEDCTNISKANDGGFSVTETGSGTAYAVTAVAPHGDNRHIKLDVEDMSPSARAGVTLKYLAGGHGNIQDTAGNPMSDNLSGILISPWHTDEPVSSVTITSAILAIDNSYLDLSVSESVYGSVYAATPLTSASLILIFNRNDGTATNVEISSLRQNDHETEALASVLNGGETIIRIFLRILGVPNGSESVEIKPVGAGIFDSNGLAAPTTLTTGIIMLNNTTGSSSHSGGRSSPQPGPTSIFTVNTDGSVSTVTFNETLIVQQLNTATDRTVITIPVNDQSSTVVTRISGMVAAQMAENNAILAINTGNIQYTLPVAQLNISGLAQQMGQNQELRNLLFSVTITEPSQETIRIVEDTARQNHYQIIVPPISFEITCSNGEKSLTVSNFNAYVERMIALPEGFNSDQVITGVVINNDGSFSPVPTTIVQKNGRYYARIQSLTNSTYLIISQTGSFPDIKGHWGQAAIEDMYSRLIVKGMDKDQFMPDREITRAEFAALIVNAMGVAHHVNKTNAFSDINTADWFYQPVNTIKEYGIIKGYEDNTYRPNQLISREEAMVIIMQAIKTAGIDTAVDDREASDLLSQYTDSNTISGWAEKACAVCSKYQIVTGNQGMLSPANKLTRAQATIMIRNMLKQSELI